MDQWITSTGHLDNLLLPNASRVDIANATSAGSGRTYWATEIVGDNAPLSDGRKQQNSGRENKNAFSKVVGPNSSLSASDPSPPAASLPVDTILCCDPTSFMLVAFAPGGAAIGL